MHRSQTTPSTPAETRGARFDAGDRARHATARFAGAARPAVVALVLACGLAACGDRTVTGGPIGSRTALLATPVATGLTSPVHLTSPPGDSRLFIVEQPGRIRIVQAGQLLSVPFLDITGRVGFGGERGLLSVAFHPDYLVNGRFFVNYTDTAGDTRVEEYTVSQNRNLADPGSGRLLLTVPQPFGNHNGGLLTFGPSGYLWIGTGDGGSGGDPQGNGQDPTTLLGALLRINVDAGSRYAIPPDNPFADGNGGAPEVWAYGLRNPWRFSIDGPESLLYVADVGQSDWEEVNVVPVDSPSVNYGWNIMEGDHCFGAAQCNRSGLEAPVHEYSHAEGCSITGGLVYRGTAIPELQGHYLYGDFCEGWVRSFRYDGAQATEHAELPLGDIGNVLSFGRDVAGEVYVLTGSGTVYRLDPES